MSENSLDILIMAYEVQISDIEQEIYQLEQQIAIGADRYKETKIKDILSMPTGDVLVIQKLGYDTSLALCKLFLSQLKGLRNNE